MHTLNLQPSQVTVRFGDSVQTFPIKEGATLVDLASRVGLLWEHHDGPPLSVDIEFKLRQAGSVTH